MNRQDNPPPEIQVAQVGWLLMCVAAVVWLLATHSTGKGWLLPLGWLAIGLGAHLVYFRNRLSESFSRQRAEWGLETVTTSPTMLSGYGVGCLAVGVVCILVGILGIAHML